MRLPPAGSGPLRSGRAEAARESAPDCASRHGGLFFRSAGVIIATACLAPWLWGGPGAGSRYQCSAVAAAEVRSRRAAGPGAASARGRSGERGRAPLPIRPRAGFAALRGGHFCHRLLGASALERTRGRVALLMRRRRREGGPAPRPARRRAPGRFGPGGPKRREIRRAPSLMLRRGAFLSLRGGHSWQRSLGASALGRTRGRVALPVLRRCSGGAPVPPGGRLDAGSRYHCSVVAATEVRSRRAEGRAAGFPKRGRYRPMATWADLL